jgi:hypothetical protein
VLNPTAVQFHPEIVCRVKNSSHGEQRCDRSVTLNFSHFDEHVNLRVGELLLLFSESKLDLRVTRRSEQGLFVAAIALDERVANLVQMSLAYANDALKVLSSVSFRPG